MAPYWDELFTQDTERKQSHAEAEATCAVMRETYTALGYKITELPRIDIASRADFVCAQLAL
ncbi:AAA family ATPase [Aquimixticola soesokkakensis]|uniref:AAA family ATPase n=1 Tax=Aquimixticola soesokkakensis TaxID=1519096 RepID=UPI00278C0E68|nr:AAA family ATPase [Aquimixticola soesokkakensis]